VARPHPMVFQTALKNGPAAPGLRRDAHDCIMVAILTDQPNTRLRGTPRQIASPPRNCHRLICTRALLVRPSSQPAAVLVTVKGTSLCDGLRPPLTVTARGANQSRIETRRSSPAVEQEDGIEDYLDNRRPIQGIGARWNSCLVWIGFGTAARDQPDGTDQFVHSSSRWVAVQIHR